MKRILIIMLGVIMLFGLFGCGKDKEGNNGKVSGGKGAASGTCGDNITWTYDKSSKTLTFTGTGFGRDGRRLCVHALQGLYRH